MAGPEIVSETGHWLWNQVPKNTGPIRESFSEHGDAEWEYMMTKIVYGSMSVYCCYYLIR